MSSLWEAGLPESSRAAGVKDHSTCTITLLYFCCSFILASSVLYFVLFLFFISKGCFVLYAYHFMLCFLLFSTASPQHLSFPAPPLCMASSWTSGSVHQKLVRARSVKTYKLWKTETQTKIELLARRRSQFCLCQVRAVSFHTVLHRLY